MRILIMGAGGVGGYFGGRLAAAGEEVTFVARGAHLAALRHLGLRVQSRYGDFALPQVQATDDPSDAGLVDLVLFCVKSYDTETAADLIRPNVGPDTAVLTIQNGVDNPEKLATRFGAHRVLPGTTYIEAYVVEPGVVAQPSRLTRIIFGEMTPPTPFSPPLRAGEGDSGGEVSGRCRRIRETLANAGIEGILSEDIWADLWRKYVLVCAFNGLTAVARQPIGAVVRCGPTRQLYLDAMEEVVRVGRASGVRLADDLLQRAIEYTDGLHFDFRSSTQRDVEGGKRLEVEALNGTVVRLGRELDIPTPVNAFLYAILKLIDEGNRGHLNPPT